MMDANAGGNENAVEVGKTGTEVMEHEAVHDDAQASLEQPAISAETNAADATAQQGNVSDWVADQWKLKFRGKEVLPKTREELINWAQQGYNYQKRNTELTEREGQYKEREAKLQQVAQLSELFEKNPDFKNAVYEVYHKFASGQPAEAQPVSGESNPREQQLLEKISALEQKYGTLETKTQTWEQQQADKAVSEEIDSIKKAHADEDWTTPDAETNETLEIELLKHADKNGFKTLEQAYRDLRYDAILAKTKADALKAAQEQKLNEQKAGVVGKGGTAQAMGQKTIPRNASYEDLSKIALGMMK